MIKEYWAEQVGNDIETKLIFNTMPLSIVIRTGQNDNGERYFDASIFTGHENDKGDNLVDVINAESLSELFKELNRETVK